MRLWAAQQRSERKFLFFSYFDFALILANINVELFFLARASEDELFAAVSLIPLIGVLFNLIRIWGNNSLIQMSSAGADEGEASSDHIAVQLAASAIFGLALSAVLPIAFLLHSLVYSFDATQLKAAWSYVLILALGYVPYAMRFVLHAHHTAVDAAHWNVMLSLVQLGSMALFATIQLYGFAETFAIENVALSILGSWICTTVIGLLLAKTKIEFSYLSFNAIRRVFARSLRATLPALPEPMSYQAFQFVIIAVLAQDSQDNVIAFQFNVSLLMFISAGYVSFSNLLTREVVKRIARRSLKQAAQKHRELLLQCLAFSIIAGLAVLTFFSVALSAYGFTPSVATVASDIIVACVAIECLRAVNFQLVFFLRAFFLNGFLSIVSVSLNLASAFALVSLAEVDPSLAMLSVLIVISVEELIRIGVLSLRIRAIRRQFGSHYRHFCRFTK
ncbi:MAG: hypothetical protein AAGI28_12400 [Pseudomonadota bacterium]